MISRIYCYALAISKNKIKKNDGSSCCPIYLMCSPLRKKKDINLSEQILNGDPHFQTRSEVDFFLMCTQRSHKVRGFILYFIHSEIFFLEISALRGFFFSVGFFALCDYFDCGILNWFNKIFTMPSTFSA